MTFPAAESVSVHPLPVGGISLVASWRAGKVGRLRLESLDSHALATLPSPGEAECLDEWVRAWGRGRELAFPSERLDWSPVPGRTRQILSLLARIPRGQVRTYAQVAVLAGIPRGYQAIGQAMRRNPFPLIVPCHRVVASDGTLCGYSAGGPAVKALLLAHERATWDADHR